jgi:hypothetical protein
MANGVYNKRIFKIASSVGNAVDLGVARVELTDFLNAVMDEHGWRETLSEDEKHEIARVAGLDVRARALTKAIVILDALERVLDARLSNFTPRMMWQIAGVLNASEQREPKWQ